MSSNLSRIVAALRKANGNHLSAEEIYQAETFSDKQSLAVSLHNYSITYKYLLREKHERTNRLLYWLNPDVKLPDYVPEELERADRPKPPPPARPVPPVSKPVPARPAPVPVAVVKAAAPSAAESNLANAVSLATLPAAVSIVRPFGPTHEEEAMQTPGPSEGVPLQSLLARGEPASDTAAAPRAIDYAEVLADLEAKRGLIDDAIVSVRKLVGLAA